MSNAVGTKLYLALFAIVLSASGPAHSQSTLSPIPIDAHSSPKAVVEEMLLGLATCDFDRIQRLMPPYKAAKSAEAIGRAKSDCLQGGPQTRATRASFTFARDMEPRISDDKIRATYSLAGLGLDEGVPGTIKLVKFDGKWYLQNM